MKTYDLIVNNHFELTSGYIHCWQAAYTWLSDNNVSSYVKHFRDDVVKFAYYDVDGNLIEIVICEHITGEKL